MEWLPEMADLLVHSLRICACLLLAYGAYVVGLRTFAGGE